MATKTTHAGLYMGLLNLVSCILGFWGTVYFFLHFRFLCHLHCTHLSIYFISILFANSFSINTHPFRPCNILYHTFCTVYKTST